jgi:hypothetical protein
MRTKRIGYALFMMLSLCILRGWLGARKERTQAITGASAIIKQILLR